MTTFTHQPPEAPTPHRFTRAEYYQMLEAGLFEGKRVELLDGEIIDIEPNGSLLVKDRQKNKIIQISSTYNINPN